MLAILYDVHANLPALEAVLDDAGAAGAESFLLGGDYCSLGAWPVETLERLEALAGAEWIRGNWERWLASPADMPDQRELRLMAQWCAHEVGEEPIARLGALSQQTVRDRVRYSHGSPLSDVRSFLPADGGDDRELIAGAPERVLVFGHTHLQFRRRSATGAELVNPGSVGLPFDGDRRAAYALRDGGGEIELRRVAYDADASARAVRDRLGPAAEGLARRIELARFDL